MDEWTTAHGLQHKVAPGEAHERLAIVERRHALIRKAVEIYLDDVKVDHVEGIKEALTFVVPQLNATWLLDSALHNGVSFINLALPAIFCPMPYTLHTLVATRLLRIGIAGRRW